MPVTSPPLVMVAVEASVLDHTPPVEGINWVVAPSHI